MTKNQNSYSFTFEVYSPYLFCKVLKNLLKDVVKFKDNSDTRVLLELINYFGFSKALKHINGMFSFALWDVKEKVLYLAIDRFGKKPLYWTDQNQDILFSSELKSIVSFHTFKKKINYKALNLRLIPKFSTFWI